MNLRNDKLHGIIVPLVTPLLDTETLDRAGIERLVEHVLAGGVHGLFLLGTTGEGPDLSPRLQRAFLQAVIPQVRRRVPVLVGITDTSFEESIALANDAAAAGADAVVLAPPCYFPAGQPELLEYLQHLTPRLPLPLLLYNMPGMTKTEIQVETLRQAAAMPGIVGFKDSSGDMIKFHQCLEALGGRSDFSILMGPEELLAEAVLFGGDGGVSGGANLFPELYVHLYDAARQGCLTAVRDLQHRIFQVRRLYALGNYASSIIKGIKCALHLKGICNDALAEPFNHFLLGERQQVARLLEEL